MSYDEIIEQYLQRMRENYVQCGRAGREVHALWRDNMLAQQRDVPAERMEWDTLSQKDRTLDFGIASGLVDDFIQYVMGKTAPVR
jgi:hypothetical protein